MDFNAIFESLMALLRQGGGAVVAYACLVCLLTEVVKRVFIPKLRIDLLNKFDPTIIVPFALGCVCAIIQTVVVEKADLLPQLGGVLANGVAIGATATVIFRAVSSLSGNSIKKLKKDDVFNLLYAEIFVYSDVKEQLLDGKIAFKGFVEEVKLVAEKAEEIYCGNEEDEQKKQKLTELMSGLLDEKTILSVIEPLHNALLHAFSAAEE